MIGGIVIEVCDRPDGSIYVECIGNISGDKGAILLRPTDSAKLIQIGDRLWWQGRTAFWTPADNPHMTDQPIPRASLGGAEIKR